MLAKIAAMPVPDRTMGERLHAIIKASAPELSPKLWYGMPAYAKDGNVVCFFQDAQKFKTRYATLGFSDKATLDEGHMWPTAFALKELTAADAYDDAPLPIGDGTAALPNHRPRVILKFQTPAEVFRSGVALDLEPG